VRNEANSRRVVRDYGELGVAWECICFVVQNEANFVWYGFFHRSGMKAFFAAAVVLDLCVGFRWL
jgi:hypothetical protein